MNDDATSGEARSAEAMNDEVASRLAELGLHPGWYRYGFVDEALLETISSTPAGPGAEHRRVPVYARFFQDRPTRIDDQELARYLELVSHESDGPLRSWALGFLVESSALTPAQLERLAGHPLVADDETRLFFLRRNLAERT